jgi:hypothetical protein
MRFLWAGLLILALPVAAWAQVHGQVLSIGFDNRYRPDCWTPMLVQLENPSPDSVVVQIQIVQEDLESDRVIFTQDVTLSGTGEGKPSTGENFWVYFKPKPTGGGLPDATDLSANLATLNSELKVFLCDKDGKQICILPITSTILNVDPKRDITETDRSKKLILFITDEDDKPIIPNYSATAGVLEDVEPVILHPRDLPNSVLGYDAVDAIVWMDADANFLSAGTRSPTLDAIRQWVRQGGNLVICEPSEPQKIKPFADMLPVGEILDGQWAIPITDRPDIDVLRRIVHYSPMKLAWPTGQLPFKVARVPARSDAKVGEWMQWPDDAGGASDADAKFTPWLARRGEGLGAVTWVAQDLGNPALTDQLREGWRFIWDRVFDWNNAPEVPENYKPDSDTDDPWKPAAGIDLGFALLQGLDLTSTAAAFVGIVCLFFVIYWLVAGPGSYFYLVRKNKAQMSWFLFAVTAIGATLMTALLVRLLVRGPPQLRHQSVIRIADGITEDGQPSAVIDSRFGLYIPQDGLKKIDLLNISPREVSTIAPFSIHPQYIHDEDMSPAYLEYQIPAGPSDSGGDSDSGDASAANSISVSIPYRSSSKKLQTHWVGAWTDRIVVPDGMPQIKLVPPGNGGYIAGSLVNHTGFDLRDIYIAFQEPGAAANGELSIGDYTWIIFVPDWPRDGLLDLKKLTLNENLINLDAQGGRRPGGEKIAFGQLDRGLAWPRFWENLDDSDRQDLENAIPMLSFFDQIPPWETMQGEPARQEFYRRGGRWMNLSPAISAGELAIVATESINGDTNKSPLPVPLNVSDSPVTGAGVTIIQSVLSLDKSAMYSNPATRPEAQ